MGCPVSSGQFWTDVHVSNIKETWVVYTCEYTCVCSICRIIKNKRSLIWEREGRRWRGWEEEE